MAYVKVVKSSAYYSRYQVSPLPLLFGPHIDLYMYTDNICI